MMNWTEKIVKLFKKNPPKPRFKDWVKFAGKQPSEEFQEAFSSHGGGCYRNCECGRQYFNGNGGWDWEEGELEHLRAMAEKDPDGYIELDYSCGTMEIFGESIVYFCPCGRARGWESMLCADARSIAEYLSKRGKRWKEEAKRIAEEETIKESQ